MVTYQIPPDRAVCEAGRWVRGHLTRESERVEPDKGYETHARASTVNIKERTAQTRYVVRTGSPRAT